MRHAIMWMLALACVGVVAGCKAGKQREEMLNNDQKLMEELRKTREELAAKQSQTLQKLDEAQTRDQELLRIANTSVSNQQQILSLARSNNQTTKAMATTLDKTYEQIYGVGVDLRSAIGETRVVIEINNDLPLRVHSEIPRSDSMGEVVDKIPIGGVIFQAQKVTDTWWKGVVLKEGEKVPIFFAGKYTRPLRDELLSEAGGGLSVEGAGGH